MPLFITALQYSSRFTSKPCNILCSVIHSWCSVVVGLRRPIGYTLFYLDLCVPAAVPGSSSWAEPFHIPPSLPCIPYTCIAKCTSALRSYPLLARSLSSFLLVSPVCLFCNMAVGKATFVQSARQELSRALYCGNGSLFVESTFSMSERLVVSSCPVGSAWLTRVGIHIPCTHSFLLCLMLNLPWLAVECGEDTCYVCFW